MTSEQKEQIKAKSQDLLNQSGYQFNKWLPVLDDPTIRTIDEIKGRISVVVALANIAFEAPIAIIKQWIDENKVTQFLSDWEREVLSKNNRQLTDNETNALSWYLDSLWALLWVIQLIPSLKAEEHIGDNLVLLVPNLRLGENNDKIKEQLKFQSEVSIYAMLDYYYRLHWYCVDERLNGRRSKVDEGVVYARRRALEWVLDNQSDWDVIEMGT